jgi:hypothetical protein
MSKTSVTSLDKRDRQSLFQRTEISSGPANSAAHVSLSSHIQLSKNRPVRPGRNSSPLNPKVQETISIAANLKKLRSEGHRRQQRRRPRSVRGLIRPTPFPSQHIQTMFFHNFVTS